MTQIFCFLLLPFITGGVLGTTSIGYIYNASYVSLNFATFITYKNKCSECICDAFFSQTSARIKGLNCYSSNKTCALFANYSTPSIVQTSLNSTFIFIEQPPPTNTTTIPYPVVGVTVAGYSNGTAGSNLDALNNPWGLAIDANNALYISDCSNARVIKLPATTMFGSIVAGTGASGGSAAQLGCPSELQIDVHSNIYVDDNSHCRIMLWRENASSGVTVVGAGGCGSTNSTIGTSLGLALDSQGALYISDKDNHRIMKWPRNATVGVVIAGKTGVSGNTNQLLSGPYGLYLDEQNSFLYIVDTGNNRIQKYRLNITGANGTTVAGGNGPGSSSTQLNGPHGVYVSKKTGDIYIADRVNSRIQRWTPGASSGVTIAGVTGMTGTDTTMLNSPVGVTMNMNETFLYVSDRGNNRVQRYSLT